ncbi:uncharacterized protein LOC9649960 [Selaginella moellendorffii]|uniref:uncharacterized protein LOC9649960 n=1 Tax=Selaginella moellendorffii TaxID=88036 RepID=UPI000D1C6D62|nr:uncharacterized protein LOC9649960 [Selaginella moellendorffii]|eukprot:XP_024537567.1 uncharacterized protein LOC9649960 [Selaginella moellendorffii]
MGNITSLQRNQLRAMDCSASPSPIVLLREGYSNEDINDYEIDSREVECGAGSYGSVRLGVYRGQAVAVKSYNRGVSESSIRREVEVMRSLKGESRVVQFLGRVQTGLDDDRCIVMELAYNLSLRALLDASGQSLSGRLKVVIARDLCGGLCSLHGRGIAHEDVKSDNVLLDFGLRAKLCDFGTARQMGDNDFGEVLGTPAFMAPEKRAAPPGSMYHRLASDIYSLGLVLQELLGDVEIVIQCLASCPLERPSCDEVLDALDHLYSSDDRDFDSFKGLLDHAIGEAERVNLACYWTDTFLENEEGDNADLIRQGRMLFYQQRNEEAFDVFTTSESAVAKLFLGIMNFHGYGCQRNWEAALELFKDCLVMLEDEIGVNMLMSALVDYYLAMIQTRMGIGDAIQHLAELSSRGNAYAQVEFANVYSLRSGMFSSCLEFAPTVNGNHRNVLDLLLKAAKTGYAHAQALLALFYMAVNPGYRELPAKEMEFLERSVEGGSLLGRILRSVVKGTIDKAGLLAESRNGALLEFIGDLYKLRCENTDAIDFYTAAANLERMTSGWARLSCMKALILNTRIHREGKGRLALNSICIRLRTLLSKRFNSTSDDELLLFFRMNRHKSTVEYDLMDGLLELGEEEVVMRIFRQSRDVSIKAMNALFNMSAKFHSDEWHQILAEKRQYMEPSVVTKIGALYRRRLQDERKAMEWWRAAAEAGDAEALSMQAMEFSQNGDNDMAVRLWEQGVSAGNDTAMLQLAICGGVGRERKLQLLQRAVDLGNSLAMVELAGMLRYRGDLAGAEKLLKQALLHGAERAASMLAFLLVQKKGQYTSEAEYWFRRSLWSLHPQVCYQAGAGYQDKDGEELIELVSKSADKLDAESLFNMGMLVASRTGLKQVSMQAYNFFAMAAEKKRHRQSAAVCFRYCYALGDTQGVEKWRKFLGDKDLERDVEMARSWKESLEKEKH